MIEKTTDHLWSVIYNGKSLNFMKRVDVHDDATVRAGNTDGISYVSPHPAFRERKS